MATATSADARFWCERRSLFRSSPRQLLLRHDGLHILLDDAGAATHSLPFDGVLELTERVTGRSTRPPGFLRVVLTRGVSIPLRFVDDATAFRFMAAFHRCVVSAVRCGVRVAVVTASRSNTSCMGPRVTPSTTPPPSVALLHPRCCVAVPHRTVSDSRVPVVAVDSRCVCRDASSLG
jgi:hypothetical protein